jgi:hypothetical protein
VTIVSLDYLGGEEAEDNVRRPMTRRGAFSNCRPVDAKEFVVS